MRLGITLALLVTSYAALATIQFPPLKGRVVDTANMISTGAEREIDQMSAGHEQATTNQVVVVTVPDLQGYTIEEFGYQLGRHWGIGQKGANNGVLLIAARDERKIRIEVGYGLEGELTDAIASNIINGVITPRFKAARFDDGFVEGASAIIAALGGQYQMREVSSRGEERVPPFWSLLIFVLVFFVFPSLFGRRFLPGLLIGGMQGGGRGHGRRGGFGGGGFSGGGGSFGGGGASGGW
ncbi:MAG: TPM domain-containing protein [Pseudomonadota bacterium]